MSSPQTTNLFHSKTNNVVILGGAGFLGLHIAHQLTQNNQRVILLDSSSRIKQIPQGLLNHNCLKKVIEYPYSDASAVAPSLDQGDVLIHLGWSQVPNDNRQSYQKDITENLAFTAALFDLAIDIGVSKVVFASSGGSVYGNSSKSPLTEGCPTEPISSYGIAKLASEKYLNLLSRGTATLPVVLRIGNAYGLHLAPNLTPTGLIPFFISALKQNITVNIWGDGEVVRDFIHVRDIAAAFCAAIEATTLNGTFNIGTGIGTSINQLIGLIEENLGKTAQITNSRGRSCDVKEAVLDASEFRRLTQWSPLINLKQGVNEIIQQKPSTETKHGTQYSN
ncbi:NAD-dependent epimerase/dehydratase family protein [Marinicella sp. S1101]|uniref:NAD-dependent epimerase/dehydratase family protein n=1 Tax=Marinicella marina TaxID=2996016 RepID=UPI002260E5D4|nr:NAD-dependent epimerase/dehydratase family protein [Marinicella marina]MCX7553242.1 NAD-dependent epimerase/dehydratase family protein [Marinicella marina]MDJ1138974.1 NAD-dependent epimerase/dehydratase family protein [Marinicella marina]